jgi:hypothetical protein
MLKDYIFTLLEDSAFSNSTRNTNILKHMKRNLTTSLFRALLAEHDGFLKELAPGIIVYYREKKTPRSPTTYHVVWDPITWRLGRKNPEVYYLRLEFNLLSTGSEPDNGRSLVGHLQNVLTPLQESLKFYTKPINLKIDEVILSHTEPT